MFRRERGARFHFALHPANYLSYWGRDEMITKGAGQTTEGQDWGQGLALTLCGPGQVPFPLWVSVSPYEQQGGQLDGEM